MAKIEIIKEMAQFFYKHQKESLERIESNLNKFLKGTFITPEIQFIFPLNHIQFICKNYFSFDNPEFKRIYEYDKKLNKKIEYSWREINDKLLYSQSFSPLSELNYHLFNPNINSQCFNCFFKFQCNIQEKDFIKYWYYNNNCNQCKENLIDIFYVYLLYTIRKKTNDKFQLFNIKFGKIVCCDCLKKLIDKGENVEFD